MPTMNGRSWPIRVHSVSEGQAGGLYVRSLRGGLNCGGQFVEVHECVNCGRRELRVPCGWARWELSGLVTGLLVAAQTCGRTGGVGSGYAG